MFGTAPMPTWRVRAVAMWATRSAPSRPGTASSALAIWAEHIGLAGFAKDYFQILWNSPDTSKKR